MEWDYRSMKQKQFRTFIDLRLFWDLPSIFKICLSDRSDGKTTQAEILCIKEFDKTGKRPIFCRRTWTEFEGEFAEAFINNLKTYDNKHPADAIIRGRKFEIKGSTKKHTLALYINDIKAVNFEALTTALRRKSSYSHEANQHIFFDEYVPLDGVYLRDEITRLLELYKTIDREHYSNKIMLTGNKITYSNPAFTFFKIKSITHDKIMNLRDGTLSVFVWSSKNNVEQAKSNPFASLTADTTYAGYNSGGFMQDLSPYICPLHFNAVYVDIIHRGRLYSVFKGKTEGVYVVDYAKHKNDGNGAIPLVSLEVNENPKAIMLKGALYIRDFLKQLRYANKLKFATPIILDEVFELWKQLL